MTAKTTLREKKSRKLRTLTDAAITVVRASEISHFTRGWLAIELGVDKEEAGRVATQMQKDRFLHGQRVMLGDFADPDNRASFYRVRGVSEYRVARAWKS